MKYRVSCHLKALIYVAPLVGAWIEIMVFLPLTIRSSVAPLVGAWIEIQEIKELGKELRVAPLVGAWIEIYDLVKSIVNRGVAPLVGAWIEINKKSICVPPTWSLLSWERGLKLPKKDFLTITISRSSRGSVD